MKSRFVRLLRFTERYTKTDMVYLVKNGGWVFLGQLVTSLSAFFVMVVLANLVEKGEYGEYRFLISMILLLSLFTLPGMNAALTQSTAKGHDGQLPQVVAVRRKWGLIASGLSLIFASYYTLQGNEGLGVSFLVVAALIPFYAVYQSYFFYLQGKQDFHRASLIQVWTQPLLIIFLVTTAYFIPVAAALIAAYLVGTTLIQYIGYRLTLRHTTTNAPLDDDVVSYGKYLTLFSSTPSIFATQIGLLSVWYFIGNVEAAIFAVAMMFPQEIDRFGSILFQIALPKMSRAGVDIKALFQKILKMELLLLFAWLGYALIADYIFKLFFPTYDEAVTYSIIGALIVLFMPRHILRAYLSANKMRNEIRVYSLVIAGAQVMITVPAAFFFGITGILCATLIIYIIDCFLLSFFCRK